MFDAWIGDADDDATGTWRPAIDPGLLGDKRWRPLLAAARRGVSFAGDTALVTGAGSPTSIGDRLVANLLRGGARVIMIDRLPLEALVGRAGALREEAGAGAVLPVQLDQGDLVAIDRFFDRVRAAGLRFTHLFPLAAVNRPRALIAIRPEDYPAIFAVNVFGVYHLAIRHMRTVPRDRPFFVVLPLSPNDGRLRGSGLYSPSKQALRALVLQGQNEFGDRRGGCYTGVDIAWTRSGLMRDLDDRAQAARAAGLTLFEPRDTADCLTLLGTPAALACKGEILDAGGGFGGLPPEGFNRLVADAPGPPPGAGNRPPDAPG